MKVLPRLRRSILTTNQRDSLYRILSDPEGESDSSSSDISNVSLNISIDSNACVKQFDNKDVFFYI